MVNRLQINRAPVLTLWAAVVAERLGYDHDAALTLSKAVAGLNAQSKGRSLGIFGEPKDREQGKEPRDRLAGERLTVSMLGRQVPAVQTEQGIRATDKDQPIDPQKVERYLEQKLGANLAEVQAAMEALARAYTPDALQALAYALYERFRPAIPAGKAGWGAAGELDLERIRSLARGNATADTPRRST